MTDIASIRLETERLILRPPNGDDLDGFCAMMADTDSARFIGGLMTRAQVWRMLCMLIGAWHLRGFAMFSVLLKDDQRWIGRIGPWQPEDWPGTEVGWAILPEFTGKGYALEASVASMNYAFDVLGWDDAMHIINPENPSSAALAKRLGSVNRGPTKMPKPFEDQQVDNWGQSREQWQENRKQFL